VADPRPHLEVVSGGGVRPAEGPSAPRVERAGGRGRTAAVWLLAALLLLAVVGLAVQGRRAAALADEVQRLTADLAATRGLLEAHRQQLSEVRSRVAELQDLVSRDPERDAAQAGGQPGAGS
jgi:uncharacterized protein HemX